MSMDNLTGHNDQIKQLNTGLIYRLIDLHGPISRISLSKKAKLAPASITKITRELAEAHLIKEIEFPVLGLRGRPAVGLEIESEGWQFLAIRINKQQLIFSLRELNTNLIVEDVFTFTAQGNTDFSQQFLDSISLFFSRHQNYLERLTAITIITRANIDPSAGIINQLDDYNIKNLPITVQIENKIGLPVYLQKDIYAWTLTESFMGAAKDCANILHIILDDQINAGVITNNHLIHADNSRTIELAHMQINREGIKCSCGNIGCLKTVASIPNLLKRINILLEQYPQSILHQQEITIEHFCQAITAKDPLCLEILGDFSRDLGRAIAPLINIFGPEVIVIGSPLNTVAEIFYPQLAAIIKLTSVPKYTSNLQFMSAKYANTGTYNSSALIKQSLYNGELLLKLLQG